MYGIAWGQTDNKRTAHIHTHTRKTAIQAITGSPLCQTYACIPFCAAPPLSIFLWQSAGRYTSLDCFFSKFFFSSRKNFVHCMCVCVTPPAPAKPQTMSLLRFGEGGGGGLGGWVCSIVKNFPPLSSRLLGLDNDVSVLRKEEEKKGKRTEKEKSCKQTK